MSLDIDRILEDLVNLNLPKEIEVDMLCTKAKEILAEESNVQYINSPVTICGDVHGQFEDVLELFRIGGEVPEINYLFLGDYVDRGYRSVETFLYLLALKIKVGIISIRTGLRLFEEITKLGRLLRLMDFMMSASEK